MNFIIRAATKVDCKDISRMIMELALFEKMTDQVKISSEVIGFEAGYTHVVIRHKCDLSLFFRLELERDGFCPNPLFECLVAEVPKENKSKEGFTTVGYGLYFYTYSTWKGRSMYLEDLYVMPEFRGFGIGKGLLSTVAKVAKEKHCARLQLSVLDWNAPSRDFYATRGAQDLTVKEGWHLIRFDGQSLDDLGNDAQKK